MRLQGYDALPRSLGRLAMRRRDLIRGGLGLVAGAVVGGLHEDRSHFALAPEAEAPPPAADPEEPEPAEPEEPEAQESVFRRGDHGDGVLALQEELGSHGFWCGHPDGGFGHLTEQAVWAVQKTHGLQRDGVAGPATRQALATGRRPQPASGGDHVEVHLGPQLLLVVRGGATHMTFNTSTGNQEPYVYQGGSYIAYTPTGDFRVWFVDGSGWRSGELGELYRPMFYDGNFAIHGSGSIPPWPASHGCARISTAAMDMFWSQGILEMGGRVLVV